MIEVGAERLSLADLVLAAGEAGRVSLHDHARERVQEGRAFIDRIVTGEEPVYGVTTGFGRLSDIRIAPENLGLLQLNLVRSHAVGVGEPLSPAETKAMMILRANVLAEGYSGVRPETLDLLISMINENVLPVIPSRGSVGASGDLAPLAHLALGLIGETSYWTRDLAAAGLKPVVLGAKEGLALLNGTQAIGAVSGLALIRAARCCHVADAVGAMTLEALLGTPSAFDERISKVRRHKGQIATAEHLRLLLPHSQIRESHRVGDTRVQDAYCLRCMPQVHGAVRAALQHTGELLEQEASAATDNPLVFASDETVISGGNFHAAPIAYAIDYAAIAVTDLLSISERRMDRLVNPDSSEGLPPFLAADPGLESGLMMAHVTMAALLNECKVLAHPASVDSVPTSGGKEDHVSMGMTSALKFRKIVENVELGLAIELFGAAQGLEFRRPLRSSEPVEALHDAVRRVSAPLTHDRSLSRDFQELAAALSRGEFDTHLQPIWPIIAN